MEIKIGELLTDNEYWQYLKEKYYEDGNVVVVDKQFLKNAMWRYNALQRLHELETEYKAVIEGQKIKEEMGL